MIVIQHELLSKVNPVFYKGGLTTCDESWRYENITINYDRFYYILEGECLIDINNVTYSAKKGQLFFLPTHSKLTLRTKKNQSVKKYWIHCQLMCDTLDFSELVKYPYFINVEKPYYIEELFQNILRFSESITLSEILEQKSYILKLLAYYICFVDQSRISIDHNQKIQKIIAYIDENLQHNISLKKLSELSNFNPNYFIRYFKAATGLTPTAFINERRILYSQKLLLNEQYSIQEISSRSGFQNQYYFSRCFKKTTGMSPTVYRNVAIKRHNLL